MKRIGINTRLLIKDKLDGIGWYQYEVLKRITLNHPEHQFYFFFDRAYDNEFVFSDNVIPVVLKPQARHPILFKIWFNKSIKKALKKYKIDLFFSPDGYLSLTTDVKQVGTIHDLNFEHFPQDLKSIHANYYQSQFPKFAKKADHIITVSNFSKTDITNRYTINWDKITVVYNGVNENYKVVSPEHQVNVRERFSAGENYFIHVGSLGPRKNIIRLIEAFTQFKEASKTKTKLLLVGSKFLWTDEMENAFQSSAHKKDILIVGRVNQQELEQLVGSALALTYVSYFEGFGMPILEAMRAGIPVITSDITSIPEVADEAALLIDPYNIEEIAKAMRDVETNPALRQELVTKGNIQVQKFSWSKCASETWDVIENQF